MEVTYDARTNNAPPVNAGTVEPGHVFDYEGRLYQRILMSDLGNASLVPNIHESSILAVDLLSTLLLVMPRVRQVRPVRGGFVAR